MILVSRRKLSFPRSLAGSAEMIDISLNGHQIWSVRIPEGNSARVSFEWPAPIRPYMKGTGTVVLRATMDGGVLALKKFRLGSPSRPIEIIDAQGRWLAMNKWDRLGPVLSEDSGVVDRLLSGGQRVATDLNNWGYSAYIVGGALLGRERNGGMLPHDDDIDFAFLCEEDNPADIGLASYRMERLLGDAGYTVVRHSLAHLELVFFTSEGSGDFYIDIFTGFFYQDEYCQPFALRGPRVRREDLLPVQEVVLNGYELPAPQSPEAWLEYAYGENWRIPDPTFKFETPAEIRRSFETWFGVFNRARNFWDKFYLPKDRPSVSDDDALAAAEFAAAIPAGANIIDLGCGDGAISSLLAQMGHRVIGVDFSHEALRIARAAAPKGVEYCRVNFNDRADLFEFGYQLLQTREPWYVFAHQTLHGLTRENRKNIFWFFRQILRASAFAYVVSDTTLSAHYRRGDPTTWHYPIEHQLREAAEFQLEPEVLTESSRESAGERRSISSTIFRVRPRDFSPELLTAIKEH